MTTRRQFGRFCAAALLFGKRVLRATEGPSLDWTAKPATSPGCEQRYRADAQVMIFGITLLHRKNVGDGSCAWRESAGENGGTVRLLEFAGRSAPERAAGLNRFGFIQELSRSGGNSEAIYFGVMTSSPEESAAEARNALHPTKKDCWYSAVDGRMNAEEVETARTHFLAAAETSEAGRQSLIERARQALASAPKTKTPAGSAPQPFLHALADLLSDPQKKQTRYAYNGRWYNLRVARERDSKENGVIRVSGSLWRADGGKPIEFRVWIQEQAPHPLPLRIEYQPKSYLRLTFEAV